jgi:hypothetical protein
MRATGVATLAFLAMHLPEFRFRLGAAVRPDGHELATILAMDLSSTWKGLPLRGVAYLAGAGCAVFHFAAGMWGAFAGTSRGARSPKGRKWIAWAASVLGAAIWIAFANLVILHATGATLLGNAAQEDSSQDGDHACPQPGAEPH